MKALTHPDAALFKGEISFPVIPPCEHFAGSEKLILKALSLQSTLGPVFDVTCDCEDGASAGNEKQHAEMIVRVLNSQSNVHRMAGVRIHDYADPHWKTDIDILIEGAGQLLSYLTLPKPTAASQVAEMIDYIQRKAALHGVARMIPIHVLIETHGALKEVNAIAALPWMQTLDFGLMDFVSAHHGAIPASAMSSPGQFEHNLVRRAKTEIVAAALAHGLIPSHNVSIDLRNPYTTYDDAARARTEFGFLRMWSVHPVQIQPIVDAMKPRDDEIADAGSLLIAAQLADWGPIRQAGTLYDRASYRYYWNVLQKANLAGVALPEAVQRAFFS